MISELFAKYKSLILYGFFGICTTAVNVISYAICDGIFNFKTIPSTAIAWFIAVVFAFITNKFWVFGSSTLERSVLRHEVISFFGCRALTGVLDIAVMYIAVDLLMLNKLFWKVISNLIVIAVNYIASKLVIFNHAQK